MKQWWIDELCRKSKVFGEKPINRIHRSRINVNPKETKLSIPRQLEKNIHKSNMNWCMCFPRHFATKRNYEAEV
jgi:hypothetical protein